ncbi:orotidine-5'-phosphate decarboxylase [Rubrivirga sp. IMCC45206]|uniref:orotidine-5'-phosphate decarboxylase n=1 Tax=Rubrivirga sp. IMCC45206 TaxID=3391614 RepID=UPI00399039E9
MPDDAALPADGASPLSFSTRLAAAVAEAGAPLCVGLDPDPNRMPASFGASAGDAAQFCIAITESTAGVAAAFKPNLAFFEAYGPDGWDALAEVCDAVRKTGRLLILDGKRGDIGNTGRRYAASLYDALGGDAATVAPYMGTDSVAPFLEHPGRCAFVLVATSNPGGADLQALSVDGAPLYRHVARLASEAAAGLPGEAGFVVGATRPALLAALREAHPEVPFLVPGVGAQGGSAADTLEANAGGPILVNSSRGILYASSGADYATAAREAAERLADSLAKA